MSWTGAERDRVARQVVGLGVEPVVGEGEGLRTAERVAGTGITLEDLGRPRHCDLGQVGRGQAAAFYAALEIARLERDDELAELRLKAYQALKEGDEHVAAHVRRREDVGEEFGLVKLGSGRLPQGLEPDRGANRALVAVGSGEVCDVDLPAPGVGQEGAGDDSIIGAERALDPDAFEVVEVLDSA